MVIIVDMNKDCKLVKDLLPNYVDNVTSKSTNKFIETHIKECPECKKLLDDMKKTPVLEDDLSSKKSVKYNKKYNKKLRILKFVVLIILFLLLFHWIRNFIIISDILKKHKESMACTNFHYQAYRYMKDFVSVEDYYVKDNKALILTNAIDFGNEKNNDKSIGYYDGTLYHSYNTDHLTGVKYHSTSETTLDELLGLSLKQEYYSITENPPLLLALVLRITSASCNTRDCYNFDFSSGHSSFAYLIDKNTGLLVRNYIKSDIDYVTDYYIDLNVVTDDDLKLPDVSEYVYLEQEDLDKLRLDFYLKEGSEIPSHLRYLLEDGVYDFDD